jgi:hypothetical protein
MLANPYTAEKVMAAINAMMPDAPQEDRDRVSRMGYVIGSYQFADDMMKARQQVALEASLTDGIRFYRDGPGMLWRKVEILNGKAYLHGAVDWMPLTTPGQWSRNYGPDDVEVRSARMDSLGRIMPETRHRIDPVIDTTKS